MTIEIHRPELEPHPERMKTGGFQNVEDVLIQALKPSRFQRENAGLSDETSVLTGVTLSQRCKPHRAKILT